MKAKFSVLFTALVLSLCLVAAGCGDKSNTAGGPYNVTVENGYVVVNGETTDVKIEAEDGKDGENGKSAYELWCEAHPDYEGNEMQWLDDLTAGKLAASHSYAPVSYGRHYDGVLTNGGSTGGTITQIAPTATGSVEHQNSANPPLLGLNNAVIALNTPIVLPVGEGAEWNLKVEGILMPNGSGGGQFLCSNAPSLTKNRVYFGINKNNNILYMGVHIHDFYFNYGWEVNNAKFQEYHAYTFAYKNGEYTLSIDGETPASMNKVNVSNGSALDTTGANLSEELTAKISAVLGQRYAVFSHMGTTGFGVTMNLYGLSATTSATYDYKTLAEHPLHNKKIFYLGSSITRGCNGDTDGVSFANFINEITGNPFVKEAINGTTLVEQTNSYVTRFDQYFTAAVKADVLVIQLSTNDFSQGKSKGTVNPNEFDATNFNKSTISGALEYLIAKARGINRNIEVYIYAGATKSTWGLRTSYRNYIQTQLAQICEKWHGVQTIDVFTPTFAQDGSFMSDDIHPQRKGYCSIFVPAMINAFCSLN